MSSVDRVDLNFPDCLAADFPQDVPAALAVVDDIVASIAGADFRSLARNSPALDASQWQWSTYLKCSVARMVHASSALRERGITGGRALDVGAYFGNFSLLLARQGFSVDALDAFGSYAPALDGPNALLRAAGVRLLDFAAVGRELEQLPAAEYDVVLCTGVIEHIPHTPRFLLAGLDRVLKVGGQLVLDTPNFAHIYNRQKFSRGESVMADLPAQYYSERPFEGHHREYTVAELSWMLAQLGHDDLRVEAFNYSAYEQATLLGRDVANHWAMVQDPTMREYLLTVSTKPAAPPATPPARVDDAVWAAALVDPERYWQQALPADLPRPSVSTEGEQMLIALQREIDQRDGLLAETQATLLKEVALQQSIQAEVTRRDDMLRQLEGYLQGEIQLRDRLLDELRANFDRTFDARLRRLARKLLRR
ncbi:MAG: class I SAM-dependent methyltransferase [Acidobacteriota bacterium]|nr:class I SAM-dependent methyltransferase [Acidobacteriota bacterium]